MFGSATATVTAGRLRRVRNLIRHAAVAASALLAATTASPATAQPAGNVVVFDDSFAANPDQYLNTVLRFADGTGLSSTSSERVLRNNPSESGLSLIHI